jgi:hypothetical protein
MTRRITVLDDSLVAETYLGKRTLLKWTDIHEISEFRMNNLGQTTGIRLVGAHGQIFFTDLISNYPELIEQIRVHTLDVERKGSPRWWRRVFVG